MFKPTISVSDLNIGDRFKWWSEIFELVEKKDNIVITKNENGREEALFGFVLVELIK